MALPRLAGVLLVLLCCAPAPVAAETVDIWLTADIRIDADGRLTALDWREQGPLHALAAQRIEPRVVNWEFEPARLNGLPVDTRTGLLIRVEAADKVGGGVALSLKEARTGPVTDALVPPLYPAGAARSGVQAIVVVEMQVGPDGEVDILDMNFGGSAGERNRKDFLAETERAVKAWRFRPEVVGGQPVLTRLRVPIDFCIDSRWCEQQIARMQLGDVPRGQPLALDSAVVLKTEIRDTGI